MILFKINSKVLSRNPTSIEQGKFKLKQCDRTINGTMVMDIIAIKNKITLKWDYMSDGDLRKLLAEIEQVSFPTIEFTDPKSSNPNTLLAIIADISDIDYKPHYDGKSESIIWKDVKVEFVER